MLFHKELNPEDQQKYLSSITSYIKDAFTKQEIKMSYQMAYDQIYQLCRNEKQPLLLQEIQKCILSLIPENLSHLQLESEEFLTQLTKIINRTEESLQKIKDVCLYLDLNYCKRELEVDLMGKFNGLFLEIFLKDQKLLQTLGKRIAEERLINVESDKISEIVEAINRIDNDEEYFLNHFIKSYVPVLDEHFKKQSQERINSAESQANIELYLSWSKKQLQEEQIFLTAQFPSKKSSKNIQFIIKEIYSLIVTNYKEQIYKNHEVEIFNDLTLSFLELLKYANGSGLDNKKLTAKTNEDIQRHADWYNKMIKVRLEKLDSKNNGAFIDGICGFYMEISNRLMETQNKFDIHYRSRFAFEEWINEEKLHMPLRLNDYVKGFCLGGEGEGEMNGGEEKKSEQQQGQLVNISRVFALMKEKKAFEKQYRRELIERLLKEKFNCQRQEAFIHLMEKQCSEDFVKSVLSILKSYKGEAASKKEITQQQNSTSDSKVLSVDVEDWPFDDKSPSATINPQLLRFVKTYTENFVEKNKDKNLIWHPIVGRALIGVNLKNWSGDVEANTCMANMFLHVKTLKEGVESFSLKDFCLQSGYKLDDVYDSVKRLLAAKIFVNKGTEEDYKLALNEEFKSDLKMIDLKAVEYEDKFEVKHLEELKADRKFMVEAILVKLIKRLKLTNRETLLKEAAPLIEKRGFNFNGKFVESAIDRLIDKEFIRDFEDDDKKLGYIA